MSSRFLAVPALILAAALLSACGGGSKPAPEQCLEPSKVDAAAPVTRLGVHFVAGSTMLIPGNEAAFTNGVSFTPTKARLYISELSLLSPTGERVKADLVDASGARLPYGVALLDFERPESMNVHLRAPAGDYRGLALSVGVPQQCESGEGLNHSDASEMSRPLDVDSDMYWSWNPGYVFVKFEGQVESGTGREGFFFHVGEDARFASLALEHDFTLSAEGGQGPELIVDFERLITSPAGQPKPDVTNPDQRRVHGGAWADALADNIRGSGFLRLQPSHH